MNPPRVLSKSISSLLIFGAIGAFSAVRSATVTWDGGGVAGTDLGTAVNWTGDVLPDVAAGDTALWDGTVTGALSLIYSNSAFVGVAGNPGINLSLAATQTDSLNIDSGVNAASLRMNNITIASGAGAFSLGNGTDVFNVTLGGAPGTHTWTNNSTSLATIASDVVLGTGGGGAHTLAFAGTGNWTLNNVVTNSSGTMSLSKSGSGALTLNGANTYSGTVTLSGGTLNLGAAAALGTATTNGLVISGNSTIDNTSGGALSISVQKGINVNADLTFTGTNNLFFGPTGATLGVMTVGGAAGSRTINVAGGTLGVGLLNSNAGVGIIKTGTGILAMGNAALGNGSTINGILDIQGGKVQVNSDLKSFGLSGSGTLENGGAAGKWYRTEQNVDTTFSGTLSDGPTAGVRLGLEKLGTGTLHLTGNVSHTLRDRFAINNGTIRLAAGSLTTGFAGGGNNALVGNVANVNARLIVEAGATFNAERNANPSLSIGSGANTRGFLQLNGGTINTTAQFNIGNGSAATTSRGFGAMTMNSGTLNSGSWVVVGANFDRAILNQSGGTLNVLTNRMTIGAGGNESHGIYNISGGTMNVAAGGNTGIFLGENGGGILTLSGTGAINLNTNGGANSGTMQFAGNATSLNGHFNLNGGTLTTFGVTKGGSTGTGIYRFNFNGGTLRANASNAAFFNDLALTNAVVNPGGAIVDSNGFNVSIAKPLIAPTGQWVDTIPVTSGGAGYLDTPHVLLSGGTGTGATAVANVSGGVVTGFTVTNRGSGYTAGDVLTATLFGGGATTAATAGAITLAPASATGGLTKNGAGTLTITTSSSSYGGPTKISAGTLALNTIDVGGVPSSLGASSSDAANLVLDGGTLGFVGLSGFTDRSFTIPAGKTGAIDVAALGSLTISGTSTGAGNLSNVGPGVLALTSATGHTGATNANAGILGLTGTMAGPLNVGAGRVNAVHQAVGGLTAPSLNLGAGSGLDFDFDAGNDVITVANAGGLTLGSTGLNLYVAGGTTPFSTNGTYTLIDYNTSYSGSLLGAFSVLNSQPGKIYSIADNTTATTIELTIGTAVPSEWTTGDGNWSVGGNWTAGSPNSIGATAIFGGLGVPPATVTIDGPKVVGNIVFDNGNTYTLAGGATDVITLNNGLGTATVSALSGSHSVSAPLAFVNPSAFNAEAGATLTVNGDISGGKGLTKSGDGIVILTGATNTFSTANVSAGTLQIGDGGGTGTLGTGAVTLANGTSLIFNRNNAVNVSNAISGAGSVFLSGTGTTTFAGTVAHTGTTVITAGALEVTGSLSGTTALSANDADVSFTGSGGGSIAGPINVANSGFGSFTLNTSGTVSTSANATFGSGFGANGTLSVDSGTLTQTGATGIVVGANGGTGTFNMNGGTINTGTGAQGFQLGVGSGGSSATATVGGGTINSTNEFWISNNSAAGQTPTNTAAMTMTGGTINSGSWFVVGRNTATGSLNLSGGTITKSGATNTYIIIGSLGGNGTVNQTGGALNATAGGIRLGENTGATPALGAAWNMSGGSSSVTGEINVAWRSSEATWNISGASTTVSATGRLIVGAEVNNAGINNGPIVNGAPVGTVNLSGGTVSFAGGDSRIGGDTSVALGTNAVGIVNVTGGTLNFGGNVQVGAYGIGTMTISGSGVVNSTAGFPVVGRYTSGVGVLNVNGGAFNQVNAAAQFIVGEEGTGTLNLNSGSVSLQGLRVGHAATGNGTVNLNGGVLSTSSILHTNAGSIAKFVFNGGTLRTTAANPDLFAGFVTGTIAVESGGGIIDTNGFNSTITQGIFEGATPGGGITKIGAGTLTLAGVESFASLTGDGGTTNLRAALGTGASTINVNAIVNTDTSQTLAALNIGDGGVMTLDSALPPPAPAFDAALDLALGDISGGGDNLVVGPAPVPEPGSAALVVGGLLALILKRRRQP